MNIPGQLPRSLEVGGKEWAIRSDFRVVLLIFKLFDDDDLDEYYKTEIMCDCIYKEWDKIPYEHKQEAARKAAWFVDGGMDHSQKGSGKKIIDWTQDEPILFSSIASAAGQEIRYKEYEHWWTFIGYMREMKDTFFSYILSLRQKSEKELSKEDKKFIKENKDIVKIKKHESDEDRKQKDYYLSMFKR